MQANIVFNGVKSTSCFVTSFTITYKGFYFWPIRFDNRDPSTRNELMNRDIKHLKEFGFFATEDVELLEWVMLPYTQNLLLTTDMIQYEHSFNLNTYILFIWFENPKNAVQTEFYAKSSNLVLIGRERGILFTFNSQQEHTKANEVFMKCNLKISVDVKVETTLLFLKQNIYGQRYDVAVNCR